MSIESRTMLPPPEILVPLCLAATLAGIVRGFTGFGSALVFVPLASSLIPPWQAVIILFIIDSVTALPLVPDALRRCTWREVLPLSFGAAFTVPLGAFFLLSVDPTALRWALAALSLGAVAVLASGWRYQSRPDPWLSAAVGATSGFLGGLCSFWGPPIAIFWLGGRSRSDTVRANVIVFLTLMTVVGGATFASHGLFTSAVGGQAALLMPIFGLAVWIGTKLFHIASETTFRRIAYTVITGAAVSSVPAFDHSSH